MSSACGRCRSGSAEPNDRADQHERFCGRSRAIPKDCGKRWRPFRQETHCFSASPDRRGGLPSALVPERVQAAGDLDRRAHAHVALENLAVIADVLDDAIGPIVGEAEALAETALDAEQPADPRIICFLL